MKRKNKNLEWYVFNHDFNTDKIYEYNIFSQEYIDKLYKEYSNKNIKDLQDLKEFTKTYLMRRYWSRAEFEMAIGGLFTEEDNYTKIDVYQEAVMNIDRIVEYVNRELDMKLE